MGLNDGFVFQENEHSRHGDECACIYVRRLLSGRPFEHRQRRFLVMQQMWFDDSGKGGGTAFVLAGYLANVEEWCEFADRWKALLKNTDGNRKTLRYVKGYEAFGLRKEFLHYTDKERDDRLLKFVGIVEECSGKGLAIAIPHETFARILTTPYPRRFKNPYMYAYAVSFAIMLNYASNNPAQEKIELIFDRDVVHRKQAIAAYKEMYRIYPPEVMQLLGREEPRFEDDIDYNALQASDLLAFCVRARYETSSHYQQVRESPVFKSLAGGRAIRHPSGLSMLEGTRTILVEIDDAHLNDFCPFLNQG